MTRHLRASLPYLLSFTVVAAGCVGGVQARPASPATDPTAAPEPPGLAILSPTAGELVQGVAIIRFTAGGVGIESPFLSPAMRRGSLPPAHLHVTVDGAPWHWVHASSDPVVIAPLPPGDHVVSLELAGADHRPLVEQSVRFTVVARTAAATDHKGHR